jgi:hypothetical protein
MSKHLSIDRREPLQVESTQTMRAISLTELNDANRQKWFVVQLVTSDRPINLEMMPRLDVFLAHRLYVVAGTQGNTTRYALRLGFFADEQSADTICGHVRTFFPSPAIVRVSAEEQARFAPPVAPQSAVRSAASSTAPRLPQAAAATDERRNQAHAAKAQSVPREIAPVSKPHAATQRPRPADSTAPPPKKASGTSGKLSSRTKTLGEELLEEARQVQRSRAGKKPAAGQNTSWLARLLGRTKT